MRRDPLSLCVRGGSSAARFIFHSYCGEGFLSFPLLRAGWRICAGPYPGVKGCKSGPFYFTIFLTPKPVFPYIYLNLFLKSLCCANIAYFQPGRWALSTSSLCLSALPEHAAGSQCPLCPNIVNILTQIPGCV